MPARGWGTQRRLVLGGEARGAAGQISRRRSTTSVLCTRSVLDEVMRARRCYKGLLGFWDSLRLARLGRLPVWTIPLCSGLPYSQDRNEACLRGLEGCS
jgi:hypothetical protein